MRYRYFLAYIAAFYTAWFMYVTLASAWLVVASHWPMAVAMIFGSYFAGSTPVGGGSVAFPILTLLFDQTAALGRGFSFAIQPVGMTSAALYVLALRRTIAWRALGPAVIGATITTPLACIYLAPMVQDMTVKLIFTCLWAGFGAMVLLQRGRFSGDATFVAGEQSRGDLVASVLIGIAGGMIASVIGVGADMLMFAYLVLAKRTDVRVAVPTGMMLMAATSIVGLVTSLAMATIPSGVWGHWLAAAPIVVIGAPFGAYMVGLIPRSVTLSIVAILCLAQFVWTGLHQRLTTMEWAWALAGVGLVLSVLLLLSHRGKVSSAAI